MYKVLKGRTATKKDSFGGDYELEKNRSIAAESSEIASMTFLTGCPN